METKLVVFKSKEIRRTQCKNDQSITLPKDEQKSHKRLKEKSSNVEQ
jgi:hypothetical protein